MKKKQNISIIGLGNIGTYFYKYLISNKKILFNKTGALPNVVYISAKSKHKRRGFSIPKKKWINNYLDVTKKKDVDTIVELIGGAEGPAKKLVFSALKNKKNVITANKALVAKYGDQLAKIAEKNRVNFEFEAAVCGGMPIIKSIKEGLIANRIHKIYGVLNGTSNYILSLMDKKNIDFKKALEQAKKLGYAESNPKSDLNGEDVASKLKILTALSFNSFINNKNISVEGINNIDQIDINNANILGFKIKLLGIAETFGNKIIQRVHPCLVNNESYMAKINGVLNAVVAESKPVGKSVLQGEGAGPGPTTSALISDLCSVMRGNIKFPFVIPNKKRKTISFETIKNKRFSVYLRLDVKDQHGVLSNITKVMSKNKISIKRLIQNPIKSKSFASIVIITHQAKDSLFTKMLQELNNKKFVISKPKLIRIEEI